MIFLFLLSLAAALGTICKSECEIPEPDCVHQPPFSEDVMGVYISSGDILPADELFQQSCESLVENLKCSRDFEKACRDPDSLVDFDAVVDNFEEFCDEESDLRKAYVAHAECFNSINFTGQACVAEYRDKIRSLTPDTYENLKQNNIHRACLSLHMLVPCIIEKAGEFCGEEAGQAAVDITTRIKSIFSCRQEDVGFLDQL